MKTTTTTEPAVYVGTYAKYNNGSIAGAWLKLANYADKEDFYEACAELHKDEADPEYMFQDHEYLPSGMISECSISDNAFDYAVALADMDDDEATALHEWMDDGNDFDLDLFREAYCGNYDNEKAYAEELADDLGYYDAMKKAGINAAYFDADSFAHDLFISDVWMSETGNVFRRD